MDIKPISDLNIIREQINDCTQKGIPFLFILNFELTEGYFVQNPLAQNDILFQFRGVGNKVSGSNASMWHDRTLKVYPISENEYKERFDKVSAGLYGGDSFLVNLTVKTEIGMAFSLEDIFRMSNAPYTLYVPGRFVCFSPERFVEIENGCLSTNPMKGTIDASIPEAENIILNDFKEKAEHNTIVDLLRNDLSMSATDVNVKRFRYVDRIKTQQKEILQVSSEIEGVLPADYRNKLGDILFDMLPAGSVSGAPKQATLKLIKEAEGEPRGYYTGIAGYFDGSVFDSAVLIRYIETENGKLFFRSGGGITAYSNWAEEYQEVLDKIYLPI